jgi:hypothetical protein
MKTKHLDDRFYPYLEKVLDRLPEEVRHEILDDSSFYLVSCDDTDYGFYLNLQNSHEPVKHLVVLNTLVLREPEYVITHAIAHEIAHRVKSTVFKSSNPELSEKEAEELIIQWGFKKEFELANYEKLHLEGRGYNLGYSWAKEHHEILDSFEEFYCEWDTGYLNERSMEVITDHVLPKKDILAWEGNSGELGVAPYQRECPVDDDPDLIKGIVFGIMSCLKEKKNHSKAAEINMKEIELAFKILSNWMERYGHYKNIFKSIEVIGKGFLKLMGEVVEYEKKSFGNDTLWQNPEYLNNGDRDHK